MRRNDDLREDLYCAGNNDDAAQRLASIVESSDDAIVSKNLNGIIMSWNRGAERLFGYSAEEIIGLPVTTLIPIDRHDEEPVILARIVAGERIDHYETVRQRKDGSLVDVSITVSPIRNAAGVIVGASKIGRDITETKRAYEQQALLLREMNHRIKNLFAVASGVVSLSVRSAGTAKELALLVQDRLAALARANDLTLPSSVNGDHVGHADMRTLIETILSPYRDGGERIALSGPELRCGSRATTAFALLLHEFATNSVKYGALSQPDGRVIVDWHGGDELCLNWREEGGPPVDDPAGREGFGSTLVEATVKGLGGRVEKDWKPSGLCIQLTAPLDRLEG